MRLRHTIILLFLSFCALSHAQESRVGLNLKGGNNATFGHYGALSIEGHYCMKNHFLVKGGLQCNTMGHFAAEARPAYFHDFKAGRLHAEALLHYAPNTSIHNYALGAGVGFATRYLNISLGYYYRGIAGNGETLCEPFNIYYSFGVSCLPSIPDWDIMLSITNSRLLELERHFQPSFTIDGWWYPSENTGITLGVACKPAGIFNITSDYYQLYINVGACYRW